MELEETAQKLMSSEWKTLRPAEQQVIKNFQERMRVSRDTNLAFEEELTLGQRVADKIASFGGSWPFIGLFCGFLGAWILVNSWILLKWGNEPFDPFPYILLNLFLSMVAALQAPLIMMSQNRVAARDRLVAANDYEVNLKAELEILALHEKIDMLRGEQWQELLEVQARQLAILERITGLPAAVATPESAPGGTVRPEAGVRA
jgi:uncharacterized membrane protein